MQFPFFASIFWSIFLPEDDIIIVETGRILYCVNLNVFVWKFLRKIQANFQKHWKISKEVRQSKRLNKIYMYTYIYIYMLINMFIYIDKYNIYI